MKKIILAMVVTALLTSTVTYAAQYIVLPWTKNIYNISDVDEDAPGYGGTVSVLDDGNNKCYVINMRDDAYASPSVAISCVKR